MSDSTVITRRDLLKKTSALGAASCFGKAPYGFAKTTPTLRVLGTHVTLQEEIRQRAMQDLGINIEYEAKGSASVMLKASLQPQSFDVYEQWSNSINILWQSGSIQALDKSRIVYWDEINALTKTGQLVPEAKIGAGDAPHKLLHVQADGSLSDKPTQKLSFLPYVHNVDAFGYNTNVIPAGKAYETESWAWLLDEQFQGRVGIINAPTIGLFDLALAAQASGAMHIQDLGAITRSEIDTLFNLLARKKQKKHFAGYWTSVPESIDYMSSGRVVLESMSSPAAMTLKAQQLPVRYAAPKEGFRGWHGVMCLSSASKGHVVDAAYDYMNWWLSGWPGAFVARQGYYIANPQRSQDLLSADEWNYWYLGKETSIPLAGTDGRIAIAAGEWRNGGSYIQRLSHIAVWNTVMPTYDYSLQKWYEFISP